MAHFTPGGSTESTFMPAQLPALSPAASPHLARQQPRVRVLDSDAFAAAPSLLAADPAARVAVLNLASDAHPGGGWRHTLGRTQEEALCFSSTLYATLRDEWYP